MRQPLPPRGLPSCNFVDGDDAISRFHNIKIIFSGALSEGGANLGGTISGIDRIYEAIYVI